MGLCERVVPGGVGRGNVMLAAAMMLAVLVVLVALGLTLAPTGSDGITDESPDNSEFNVVESGLQQAVFVESNDTLDPAYDPEFHPPDSDGPPPIDNATVAALLAPEPFTDEQVVQIQSLLMSLGYRSMGGDIAALEPVPGETETGVLIRLGNLEPRDLGDTDTPLVENATAVRDVELLFERTTLPTAPENATTAHVGNWTLAAYQNTTTDRVHYQLGQYDPDDSWHTTGQAENLHVNVHEGTVNGAPIADGLGFDPGEPPVDVQVRDTNRSNPGGTSTHGGLNAVAVGAGSGDVDGETISAETDWQEVVTRPVFNTTYLDATTTLDTRLAVDARYTHFKYAHDGSEPFLMDVSLAVQTEDRSVLDKPLPAGNIWLPDYTLEQVNYTIDVVGTYSNGTEVDLSGQANVSIRNRTASGLEDCADGQDCVSMYDDSEGALFYNYLAIPHTLTDVQVQAEVPDASDTLRENVTIVDPYIDTNLAVAADLVAVTNSLGSLTMELVARKGDTQRTIPGPNISSVESLPARHAVNGLSGVLGIQNNGARRPLVDALRKLRTLNSSERASFLDKTPADQAEMLGEPLADDLLRFFDSDTVCEYPCTNFTAGDAVAGPHQSAGYNPARGPQSQLGLIYRGHPDIDMQTFQQLDLLSMNRTQNGRGNGGAVSETKLLELGTDQDTLVDPQLATQFVTAVGWDDTETRNQTAHLVLRYIELFHTYAGLHHDTDLFGASETQLKDVASGVRNDHINDEVSDIPQDFDDTAASFIGKVSGSYMPQLHGSNYHTFGPAQQAVYWWLSGIDDAQTREELHQLVAFGDETEAGIERSTELLFDIADYNVLDQQVLDQGHVELATLDELVGDWAVTMTGSYTDYTFGNYSATDTVTVTDPAATIENISVSLDTQSLDPITDDPPTLYSDGVLEVNNTADITTTVTYTDGSTETNPDYIEYDLLGPSFTAGPCAYNWQCANYTGPTTPDGFASVDGGDHTVTPHHETGLVQASRDGQIKNSNTIKSGPLVVQASVTGTNTTDPATTDTASTSVVNLEVGGYLEPEEKIELEAHPDDGPQKWATNFGAKYRIQHTPTPAATQIPFVDGNDNWTATRTEQVPDWQYINVSTGNVSDVSYVVNESTVFGPGDGGIVYSGPEDPDNATGDTLDIWFDESDALGVSDIYDIDDVLNADRDYLVDTDGDCTTCGEPGGPDLTGSLSVTGSKEETGKIFDTALTTLQNEDYEVTETVDPTVERGNYTEFVENPGVAYTLGGSENETTPYYLWSNAGAMASADGAALSQGTVSWRNDTGCSEINGCTSTPNGIVDHLDGPNDVAWESKIQSSSGGSAGVTVVAFSNTSGKNEGGRHEYDIGFNVTGSDVPDSVSGTITFKAFRDDWDEQDWLEIPFDIETEEKGDVGE